MLPSSKPSASKFHIVFIFLLFQSPIDIWKINTISWTLNLSIIQKMVSMEKRKYQKNEIFLDHDFRSLFML